ncbi:MAG TPA: hypothetical protein PLV92_28460, partial [Pirellulaceae bacterium]|nr:hypothetical protein [Pirellulaceae bacterium]
MWGNGATTIVLASSPTSTSPTSTSPMIGVDDGGWLVLDSQILQAATGVSSNGLVKVGGGRLEFQGALPNTYLGSTLIAEGTLRLNKRAGATSGMSFVIGDNVGANDTLEVANAEQLFDAQTHVVQSTGVLKTLAFPASTSAFEMQQLSLYGVGTFRASIYGSQTPDLSSSIAPSGGSTATASLENALNALATKPANITFVVSGTPSSYTITFRDSNASPSDQPAVTLANLSGVTGSVATLTQAGTTATNETQLVNLGTSSSANTQLNFGGLLTTAFIATATTPQSLQQALESISAIGAGGVVVTPVTSGGVGGVSQQVVVTFTEGASVNLRGVNLVDLAVTGGTNGSVVAGTQGGQGRVETIGLGATG